MEGQKNHEFKHFYRVLFSDRVACIVLGALGTHLGRYEYWQREYAFGWGESQWNRRNICYSWRDALRLLRRDGCNAINFGAMFSRITGDAVAAQALTPYDLAAAPAASSATGTTTPGPRDWERKHVWHQGCGTPVGELVIDIDLDDQLEGMYNRQGICECAGQKRTVCAVCWHVFMDPAQMALELLLNHLGIRKYLMYFSGRRGVHCMLLEPWILDMTNDERARFMEVISAVPTEHSDLGRAMYALLAPFVAANPVLRARCQGGLDARPGQLSYAAVMRELYPKMDIPVGADASHLHGVPLTLHPETRVLRIPIGSASNPKSRFSYANHRFDVDRLTRDTTNIMWACALRVLSMLLGPNSTISPSEYVERALSEGGRATSKSEVLN